MRGAPHPAAGWGGDLRIGLGSPKVVWQNPKITSNYCSSHRSAVAVGDRICTGLKMYKKLIFFCFASGAKAVPYPKPKGAGEPSKGRPRRELGCCGGLSRTPGALTWL